jgi:phosphohistidine phosphatase
MPTTLVAVRHGKPITEGYFDPDLYPLSKEGKIKQKEIVKRLKKDNIIPDVIYSSPLLRSLKTAKVIAEAYELEINEIKALNEFDEDELLQLLFLQKNKTVFFVGHAPTLANFVNKLVGEDILKEGLERSSAAILEFEDDIDYGKAKFIKYYKP